MKGPERLFNGAGIYFPINFIDLVIGSRVRTHRMAEFRRLKSLHFARVIVATCKAQSQKNA